MFETILSASIPAVALIIVQLIISMKQQRVQDVRFELTIKEIKDDIKRLNALIERMTTVERDTEAQWRWIDEFKGKI